MPKTNPSPPPKIEHIKLSLMDPMPGNREFGSGMDKKSLADLSASILAQGIIAPLIVRPNAAKKGRFEIVAGVRRHLAAGQADLNDAPCVVRDLTDAEAREIRIIENLQRAGIHEMEEARGYQELLDLRDPKTGTAIHTMASITERIGKSEAYVYARLKLLRMPDVAQEAFLKGKLNASVALLICRIPDLKVAHKATLEVLDRHGSGITPEREKRALDPECEPMSFRQAKGHVQDHYMKRLKGAKFDQEDETLVPVAYEESAGVPPASPSTPDPRPSGKPVDDFKARESARKDVACAVGAQRLYGGKCSDCPFRTGNMKKLAPDVVAANDGSTDVCTNTACYQRKEKATVKREQEKFKDKGQELLTEGKAKRILNWEGDQLASSEYIDLRAKVPGKKVTWEEALEEHLPEGTRPMVARGKKTFLLLPVETAFEAAKKAGIKMEKPEPRSNGHDPEAYKREQEKRDRRIEFCKLLNAAAFEQIIPAAAKVKPDELLRFYVETTFHHTSLRLLDWKGKEAPDEKEWYAAIHKMPLEQLALHLVVNHFPRVADYQGNIDDSFGEACKHFGVDFKKITEAVGKEQKAAEAKDKKEADPAKK